MSTDWSRDKQLDRASAAPLLKPGSVQEVVLTPVAMGVLRSPPLVVAPESVSA